MTLRDHRPLRRLGRRTAAAAVAGLALLVSACEDPFLPETAPSAAMSGVFDGEGHPYVGALLYDWRGDGITGVDATCTGTLVAPDVFLTAAHCLTFVRPGEQLWVTFDADLLDAGRIPSPLIPVTSFVYDPRYVGKLGGASYDLGLVFLPAGSTAGIAPAQLPTAGLLDVRSARGGLRGVSFEGVGYGVDANNRGQPAFSWDGRRNLDPSPFMALTQHQLGLLINRHATGESGDCYGDSGGPKLLPGTNVVVAVVSWGDAPCRATSWNTRLDTQSARAFLGQYLTLP